MHMTREEHVQAAKMAWEYSQAEQDKLGRKMEKAVRKAEKAGYGVEYAVACSEIEVIRVQYAALALETNRLWDVLVRYTEE